MKKVIYWLGVAVFIISMSQGKAYALEALSFDISGFVDASFFYDDDADTNTFGLDQTEINISKEITDWASLRFDLQHFPSGTRDVSGGTSAATFPTPTSSLTGATITDDDVIEQGYLTLTAPGGEGLTFTFGKFNAPIGFELLDPVDMYQFSHALVFNLGIPTNLVGAMFSTSFIGNMLDISFYVVNGWDNEPDTNKDKTFGGRIGVTPTKGLNFGISGITGKDGSGGAPGVPDTLTVIDIDGTITVIPNLTLGMELNKGWDEQAPGINTDDEEWWGFLLMGHYDYTEWGGITLRYDYFDDDDLGTRLVTTRAAAAIAAGITSDTRQAITISPTFVIAEGFGVLFEYRYDFSNKNVFIDSKGVLDDNNSTIAFEMTYAF